MSEFKLYRHKAGADKALYWIAQADGVKGTRIRRPDGTWDYVVAREIRSPVNAAGNGSESPGELLSPEASARSGLFPAAAIRRDYILTTPEELGLKVVLNA